MWLANEKSVLFFFQIIDIGEVQKLQHIPSLRCLNLQRNPIEQIPDQRLAVIFAIPQLAILDMEEITLKEQVGLLVQSIC